MANPPIATVRACVRIPLRNGGDAWNWARYLRCSESDLRKAVKAVGDVETDVRNYLLENASRAAQKAS